MENILLIILLVVALALVGVILLQQGKGAGMGASFGAGASGTVFGSSGSGNVLTKVTTVLAIIFFGIAMALGYIANDSNPVKQKDIFDELEQSSQTIAVDSGKASDIPEVKKPSESAASDIPEVTKPAEKAEPAPTEEEPVAKQDDAAEASDTDNKDDK